MYLLLPVQYFFNQQFYFGQNPVFGLCSRIWHQEKSILKILSKHANKWVYNLEYFYFIWERADKMLIVLEMAEYLSNCVMIQGVLRDAEDGEEKNQ